MRKVKKLIKLLLFILIVILVFNTKNILREFFPCHHQEIILKYSHEFNVDPYLVCAVINTESNFKEDALSSKNAHGLMQVTPPTAEWIADKLQKPYLAQDLGDVDNNIHMGTYYLSYLLDMYDANEKNALCAYNAGFNNVDNWLLDSSLSQDGITLDKIPFPETERYYTKVSLNKEIYKFIYTLE